MGMYTGAANGFPMLLLHCPCYRCPCRAWPPATRCQLLLCVCQCLAQLAALALQLQQAALQPLHLGHVACSNSRVVGSG